MLNPEFNRMLRQRKATIESVAKMIFSNPKAVTLVLGGRRPGQPTWKKLGAVLSKDEFDCARDFAEAERKRLNLPALPPYRPPVEKAAEEAVSD